jgi:protein-S-isoprenylcysteine O-methyltransferase Ste14
LKSIDKSNILVTMQFTLIGLLIWGSVSFKLSVISLVFISISFLLAVWAVVSMKESKLRISPIPAKEARMIINGPYRVIRHPMYTSIIIGMIGLLIIHFSIIRLIMFLALIVVLIIKLNWEEKMLLEKFSGYKNYRERTNKLIPFIY